MGLLDRMIRNVANDVLGDAVRQVERNASNAISGKVSSVVDDYAETTKTKIQDKKVEMRNKIIEESEKQKTPDIVANGDKNEILKFASKTKVKYHFLDSERNINKFVPMIVIGAMNYPIEKCGKYEGQDDVAAVLSDAVFSGLQKAFDELSDKTTEPEEVFSKHALTLTDRTKKAMEGVCADYKIEQSSLAFSVIYPTDAYVPSENTSNPSSDGASWTCQYCGSVTSGITCQSCGAPRE